MRKALINCAIVAYAIGAVFTFGLVYNRIECDLEKKYLCAADAKAGGSMIAAMVWPLSLSAIWQGPRP